MIDCLCGHTECPSTSGSINSVSAQLLTTCPLYRGSTVPADQLPRVGGCGTGAEDAESDHGLFGGEGGGVAHTEQLLHYIHVVGYLSVEGRSLVEPGRSVGKVESKSRSRVLRRLIGLTEVWFPNQESDLQESCNFISCILQTL